MPSEQKNSTIHRRRLRSAAGADILENKVKIRRSVCTHDAISAAAWMGGRVVEGTGLENRQAGDRLVGSNPTPSATLLA